MSANQSQPLSKMTGSQLLVRVLIYSILIFFAIIFLIPVYMVVVTSVKSFDQVSLSTMWNFPTSVTLDGFREAFSKLAPNLMNSVALVLPATAISAMLGSLNGYILSKWKFKGSDTIFALMLFGMFIPYQSILIPLVRFLGWVGLSGNIGGLIVADVIYGIPITTLIFRNYYTEIPTDLIEAAKIDGADFFGIFTKIILPISAPGFVVVIIWQITQIWNEFMFAVSIVTAADKVPITVALQNLSGAQVVEWNVQMAGAFLAALPPLLIYIILGRYFIRGLLAGSVKG
jgi:glucose/mannose transport system permease protein